MLAYTLFSSSHQIINGPESTTAILLATTVAPLAMIDSARYAALAGAHALFSVRSYAEEPPKIL